jgi:hypothetical protein
MHLITRGLRGAHIQMGWVVCKSCRDVVHADACRPDLKQLQHTTSTQPAQHGCSMLPPPTMICPRARELLPADQRITCCAAVWPDAPAGMIGTRAGPILAASDRFEIVVTGRGGHAAMPHLAVDPVVCGAAVVMGLQPLVAREVGPTDAAVLSVTRFNTGGQVLMPRRGMHHFAVVLCGSNASSGALWQ